MSRELPARPSLDHLRKQARQRLRELQAHAPDTQLADAQHAIAREYGFASWPKLKAHVNALAAASESGLPPAAPVAAPSPEYGFSRYSERARRATFFSRWEASRAGSPTIEQEHLLLGLVNARQGLAAARPSCFAPPLPELRAIVAGGSPAAPAPEGYVVIPFSDRTKAALARAAEAARSRGDAHIGTAHLLLGLMQSASPIAASIFAQYGVSERTLLDDADAFLSDG